MAEFFKRVEKKYMINKEQYKKITDLIKDKTIEDPHGISTICNVYFDSPDYSLIRRSIEKPEYKDKIRIRSYNVPNKESNVFVEIKRKVNGIVTKRRIMCSLEEAKKFAAFEEIKKEENCKREQVSNEINYYFSYYKLEPKAYIAYDRRAYYAKDDKEFRITFDNNILARMNDLKLEDGVYGQYILDNNNYVMEVKTLGAVPLWFTKIISDFKLTPCTYSKYGEVYTNIVMKNNKNRRILNYV